MKANDLLVARRYAQAVLEIGLEQSSLDRWRADLQTMAGIWRGTGIVTVLDNPKLGQARRMDEARNLLGEQVSPMALNLVLLLIRKGRVNLIPRVADAFERIDRDRSGRVTAVVTSAIELTPQQRDDLRVQLHSRTSREVDLDEKVDASILGGLIVRVGDELIDASVAGRLRRIEVQLSS